MSPDARTENIAEELAQSAEALRAAEALASLSLYRDAVSRLYYAIYHATLAVLLTEDLEPTTHRGVLTLFGLHFVKPGKLPASMGVTLRRIQGYGEAADYTRGFLLPESECTRELCEARLFIDAVRAYVAAASGAGPQGT